MKMSNADFVVKCLLKDHFAFRFDLNLFQDLNPFLNIFLILKGHRNSPTKTKFIVLHKDT